MQRKQCIFNWLNVELIFLGVYLLFSTKMVHLLGFWFSSSEWDKTSITWWVSPKGLFSVVVVEGSRGSWALLSHFQRKEMKRCHRQSCKESRVEISSLSLHPFPSHSRFIILFLSVGGEWAKVLSWIAICSFQSKAKTTPSSLSYCFYLSTLSSFQQTCAPMPSEKCAVWFRTVVSFLFEPWICCCILLR